MIPKVTWCNYETLSTQGWGYMVWIPCHRRPPCSSLYSGSKHLGTERDGFSFVTQKEITYVTYSCNAWFAPCPKNGCMTCNASPVMTIYLLVPTPLTNGPMPLFTQPFHENGLWRYMPRLKDRSNPTRMSNTLSLPGAALQGSLGRDCNTLTSPASNRYSCPVGLAVDNNSGYGNDNNILSMLLPSFEFPDLLNGPT